MGFHTQHFLKDQSKVTSKIQAKTRDENKSDITYLKTSHAFDVPIHSRVLLEAILC